MPSALAGIKKVLPREGKSMELNSNTASAGEHPVGEFADQDDAQDDGDGDFDRHEAAAERQPDYTLPSVKELLDALC